MASRAPFSPFPKGERLLIGLCGMRYSRKLIVLSGESQGHPPCSQSYHHKGSLLHFCSPVSAFPGVRPGRPGGDLVSLFVCPQAGFGLSRDWPSAGKGFMKALKSVIPGPGGKISTPTLLLHLKPFGGENRLMVVFFKKPQPIVCRWDSTSRKS